MTILNKRFEPIRRVHSQRTGKESCKLVESLYGLNKHQNDVTRNSTKLL